MNVDLMLLKSHNKVESVSESLSLYISPSSPSSPLSPSSRTQEEAEESNVTEGNKAKIAQPQHCRSNLTDVSNETIVHLLPCTSIEDATNYRCRCSFQIVEVPILAGTDSIRNNANIPFHNHNYHPSECQNQSNDERILTSNGTCTSELRYAIRESDRGPVPILGSYCIIACQRIQRVMSLLIWYLQHGSGDHRKAIHDLEMTSTSGISITSATTFDNKHIRQNLTSVTFVSSWVGIFDDQHFDTIVHYRSNDVPIATEDGTCTSPCDCIVTLHYDSPIEDIIEWKRVAHRLCILLNVNQILGRSRKRIVQVLNNNNNNNNDLTRSVSNRHHRNGVNYNDDGDEYDCVYLRDTLWLTPPPSTLAESSLFLSPSSNNNSNTSRNNSNKHSLYKWNVGFTPQIIKEQNQDQGGHTGRGTNWSSNSSKSVHTIPTETISIPVLYEKSVDAFFHPNPKVMCNALSWILNRISLSVSISKNGMSIHSNNNNNNSNRTRMVELYCGCGAHTIAIAKTQLVPNIVAVEYDPRLVQALERNCTINNIQCNNHTATNRHYQNYHNSVPTTDTAKNRNSSTNATTGTTATNNTTTTVTTTTASTSIALKRINQNNGDDRENMEASLTTKSVDETTSLSTMTASSIDITCSDAGMWAREQMTTASTSNRWNQSSSLSSSSSSTTILSRHQYYDILLVDPPRQGLCEGVLDWIGSAHINNYSKDDETDDVNEENYSNDPPAGASNTTCTTTFGHILYVSCGKEDVLHRDIQKITSCGYEVIDCTVFDLFPGTTSTETLIHFIHKQKAKQ